MKVCAITGAGQGIGRAIAFAFADAGHAISFIDPDQDAGRETARMLEERKSKALYLQADVSDVQHVKRWIEQTTTQLGCPDVLVNNAGINRRRPFLDLSPEDFDRVLAVNLRGTFLCSQAVAREMLNHGKNGAIVNVASTRAFMSEPGTEAYSASKGGIVALTHAMAISLGPHRIRVNCISPGWIETRDWQYTPRAKQPVHSERDRLQHPVGRVGKPEDIAEACVFLANQGFMTGQNLVIDGGMTVKMIYEE